MKLPISKLVNNNGQLDGVPKNPRQIKGDDYDKLLNSLKEDPDFLNHKPLHVVEHGDKYVVLGGNMRLKALKELGYKDVPVTVYAADTPPETLRARIMKDNAQYGDWDMDMLANEWSDEPLDEWGVDLPEDWLGADDGEVEEDEAPEVDESEPPKSKLGEIYQLGRHRVMCGDSTDKANVELLMDGVKPDGVHTDPPYGLGKKMSGGTWATKASHYSDMHEWDKVAEQSFFDTATSQGCDAIVWGGNYFTTPPSRGWLIWKKPNFPTMADCEIAFTTKDMNARVLESNRSDPNKLHPTQKPMEVTNWALGFLDGKNILDLFLGSGSTLIACEQADRTCYGMELDEKYLDVIRKRWAKYVYPDRWEKEWEILTPAIEKL